MADGDFGQGRDPQIVRGESRSTFETQVDGSTTNTEAYEYARLQDLFQVHILCDSAKEDDEASWDEVRVWFRSHSAEDAHEAAVQIGDYKTTSLHLACRNCPPGDIVELLLTVAPETIEWADSFGWLPLHYACANGASEDVLRKLANTYPDSKTATDRRGRTPLHFALGNTERPARPDAVVLLSTTGAAACPDENGMLPLHYACAFGASGEALKVLTDNNPYSITATDKKGRTPLHFALGNADRLASPAVVKLLLSLNRSVVNSCDRDGQLPLHLLATRAKGLQEHERNKRENAQVCLDLYLQAGPKPTVEFLTALQSLPNWLRDRAVVTPIVQHLLNEKISQRFPTAALLLDAYFLCVILVSYYFAVLESLDRRYDEDDKNDAVDTPKLIPLYIGAAYFLLREMVQMLSLQSLGLFSTYLYDGTNWIDVSFIFLVLFWTVMMNTGDVDKENFKNGAALSLIVLWGKFLSFLKSSYIDFAVFSNGVLHVVRRLAAFLVSLIIILVAFAQMFTTVFRETSYCELTPLIASNASWPPSLMPSPMPALKNTCAEPYEEPFVDDPFCDFWFAFIKVYTMLLGEVSEKDFEDSSIATFLFVIFMFLVVILLANVLIAIVTDSYGVIRNERAAIVFWSNRLDFVAEMDVISTGPWKKRLNTSFSRRKDDESASMKNHCHGRDLWKKLIELFEEIEDRDILTLEFWCHMLLRWITAFVIIPIWLSLGVLSAGWLWPPQVRESLLTQRVSKNNPGDIKESEQRMAQVKSLLEEVNELQDEFDMEIDADRKELMDMKSKLKDMKTDIKAEMKNIKQIMTVLFDLQSTMG